MKKPFHPARMGAALGAEDGCCINVFLERNISEVDASRFVRAFLEHSATEKQDLHLIQLQYGFMLKVCGGPLADANNWLDETARFILKEVEDKVQVEVDHLTFGCS